MSLPTRFMRGKARSNSLQSASAGMFGFSRLHIRRRISYLQMSYLEDPGKPEMAKTQKEWAKRRRDELMALLGRVCALCGSTERLEFDCIKPMGDAHHRFDTSHRISFYRRQHAAGNLQVLCSTCNSRKGAKECYPVPCDGKENEPF